MNRFASRLQLAAIIGIGMKAMTLPGIFANQCPKALNLKSVKNSIIDVNGIKFRDVSVSTLK